MRSAIIFCALLATAFGGIVLKQDSRIVKGRDCYGSQVPYLVNILYQGNSGCQGSIIGEDSILTSGRCVYGQDSDALSIQYGVLNTQTEAGKNVVAVKEIRLHKDFEINNKFRNDIAILKLKEKIPLSYKVKPVIIPEKFPEIQVAIMATVAGWGLNHTGSTVQPVCHYTEMPFYHPSGCLDYLPADFDPAIHICAGDLEGNQRICSGDEGAPLVTEYEFEYTQYGIASWFYSPCDKPDTPGFFTNVVHFRQWIADNRK